MPTPPSPRRRRALAAGGLVLVYLTAWALVRPPLQSPDEPQHLLKANSVRLQPWLNAVPDRFVQERRTANPLALDTPAALDKLFFRVFNALTIDEIDGLRAVPWYGPEGPPLASYQRAIATYPQVYYWAVYGLAEPVIRGLGLSPWDATYAYRLVTCLLVAIVWGLVWDGLERTGLAVADAAALFALTLLTPMLGFMASAVNPDALNTALCALAIVSGWRVLAPPDGNRDEAGGTNRARAALAASLLGAAMTKPSGLQLAAVLGAAAGGLALAGLVERRRAAAVIAIGGSVIVVAFAVFYLWQPPRFMAGGPSADSLSAYLATRWASIPVIWEMYWGRLGWLEYVAPAAWYRLMLGLVVASAACAAWRPRRPASFAVYLAAVWVLFFVSTFVAEFRYLREAGYTFQGRYLLPAALAFGVVVLHEVKAVRIALLAGVLALNVVLVRETVRRYYVEGWRGAVHALPLR
jgi:hypothetical protein